MELYLRIVYFINTHDITTSGAILDLSTLCDNRLCSIYKVLTRDVSLKQHKTTIEIKKSPKESPFKTILI